MAAIRRRGIELIVVSSGAIGVGMGRLGLVQRPHQIGALQAVAAVGQNLLMNTYEQAFRDLGFTVAQILVTANDLADRQRYVNFTNALHSLFRYNVVPIINENDTVAVDEIRVGDNDTLSAHVANAVDADLLVILSDTDGVYTADPHRMPEADRIPIIEAITPEIRSLAKKSHEVDNGARLGTGRLETKLQAAEIATSSGVPVVIAPGYRRDVLLDVLEGEDVGTLFVATASRTSRRKRWIAFARPPKGALIVDAGAYHAVVHGGKSLLPAGIRDVRGHFVFGDSVRCLDESGMEFARGLTNYSSEEIVQIRGKRTDAIADILGYHYADEVIHRDNLVLMENGALHPVSMPSS